MYNTLQQPSVAGLVLAVTFSSEDVPLRHDDKNTSLSLMRAEPCAVGDE
jgi:hypothetical protein